MKTQLVLFALLITCIYTKSLYNSLNTNVININQKNWENQVNKGRNQKRVFVVHFYRNNDHHSPIMKDEYIQAAEDYFGLVKWGAVNCDESPQICDKQGVQNVPVVKIYPPIPMPARSVEGPFNGKRIAGIASSYIQSLVQDVTDDNVDGFLKTNFSVPKVMLFTDKPSGIPSLWKALSIGFEEKITLGIVRKDQKDVVSKYNIKKYPSIVLTKTSEKRPQVYTGELKYKEIFEWLNVHSEQFVYGGGSSAEGAGPAPWLNEAIPELFGKSAKDVCFGQEGALCVILFTDSKPDKDTINHMKDMKRYYETKGERAITFKFMWLNAEIEQEWNNKLGNTSWNNVYVLNPGRRKRYLKHEGTITFESLQKTLEKIIGGDGRFTMLRGNALPVFTNRN